MLSRQEIFDIVYTGLRNQGWHRSVNKEFCMYRASDGKKCAFGHLIPDELYHPSFENKIATNLAFSDKFENKIATNLAFSDKFPNDIDHEALVKFREWANRTLGNESTLISDLQYFHDNGFYPEKMKMDFNNLAIQYELKIPD